MLASPSTCTTELCQWPKADGPQCLVTLRRFNVLGESGHGRRRSSGRSPSGAAASKRRVDAFNGGDQAFSLLDEAIRTLGGQDVLHPPEGWCCLGILLQLGTVEGVGGIRRAELIPGWLLVLVKVFQIVVAVREVEQFVFAFVEPFNEGVRLLTCQECLDECQAVVDFFLARILARIGQGLVAEQRGPPAFEPGAQERVQGVFAIWPHGGEHVFAESARVLEGLGIGGFALDDDDPAPFTG